GAPRRGLPTGHRLRPFRRGTCPVLALAGAGSGWLLPANRLGPERYRCSGRRPPVGTRRFATPHSACPLRRYLPENRAEEVQDAGNLHVRDCVGWGRQHPHLLGRAGPRRTTRASTATRTTSASTASTRSFAAMPRPTPPFTIARSSMRFWISPIPATRCGPIA